MVRKVCLWCVSCLVCRTEGDIGLVLEPVILWRLKGFPVLYVTYTVNPLYYLCCRLPSYLTLSLTKSSPTPLLTISSLCTTHTSLFSPPITPSCHHHHSVRVTDSPTLLLIFCSLFPWFHLFLPPLLPPFIPLSIFFRKSFHTPREKHRFDKHWESGTNHWFVDVFLALPLWLSAENKVFIKRNLPNLLPTPSPPLSAPLSPTLVNGEPVSGTCPPCWDFFLSYSYISLAKSHLSWFLISAFLHFLP